MLIQGAKTHRVALRYDQAGLQSYLEFLVFSEAIDGSGRCPFMA